jgi:hypothetical protein
LSLFDNYFFYNALITFSKGKTANEVLAKNVILVNPIAGIEVIFKINNILIL